MYDQKAWAKSRSRTALTKHVTPSFLLVSRPQPERRRRRSRLYTAWQKPFAFALEKYISYTNCGGWTFVQVFAIKQITSDAQHVAIGLGGPSARVCAGFMKKLWLFRKKRENLLFLAKSHVALVFFRLSQALLWERKNEQESTDSKRTCPENQTIINMFSRTIQMIPC